MMLSNKARPFMIAPLQQWQMRDFARLVKKEKEDVAEAEILTEGKQVQGAKQRSLPQEKSF
jgi:tRNA-dihydrouridine synthase